MATRVPQTGANQCWDTEGREIDGKDTGQDGDIRAGVPIPPDRFHDNGDGTVTDTLTELVWLKDADRFGEVEWDQAVKLARNLKDGDGLKDGSSAGDWRLANIRELLSLIDYSQADPIINDGGKFDNIRSAVYWTSTTMTPSPRLAWMMTLGIGPTVFVLKDTQARMWPVRGTSRIVLRTGQEDAWDEDGKKLSSPDGSGQDGDHKAGVPLPVGNRRFLKRNGSVIDRLTGLVWLENADAFGFQTWGHALECCNQLKSGEVDGLTDGSTAGQWRLPNIREIESLVDYGKQPDGSGCVPEGHPFRNLRPSSYWTSTTVASGTSQAMFIILGVGPSIFEDKDHKFFVWPVRDASKDEAAHYLA